MKKRVSKLCCVYDDIPAPRLIATTLVTPERWSAAVAYLVQQLRDDDTVLSGLSEQDLRLLSGYRRVFSGKLNRREAYRLLGCLGWVPI
jgi:hypothetical protein